MAKFGEVIKVLDDVTATTTSQAVNIEGATKVLLFYKRADHSSGSSAFSAQVSVDGSNYVNYNKWVDNVTNTNSQNPTRVSSKTLSADGVDFVTMSRGDGFKYIKVKVTEVTDGTHSAWLYIEY